MNLCEVSQTLIMSVMSINKDKHINGSVKHFR